VTHGDIRSRTQGFRDVDGGWVVMVKIMRTFVLCHDVCDYVVLSADDGDDGDDGHGGDGGTRFCPSTAGHS
jgi:hypothetical protein